MITGMPKHYQVSAKVKFKNKPEVLTAFDYIYARDSEHAYKIASEQIFQLHPDAVGVQATVKGGEPKSDKRAGVEPSSTSTAKIVPSSPPAAAEFLCGCLTTKKLRRALIGDLAQDYSRDVENFGKSRADRLYWATVFRSVVPLAYRAASRIGWASLGGVLGRWLGS